MSIRNALRPFINPVFPIIVILSWSCANPVAPTGGPKDVTPPEVMGTQPENASLNFKDNKIELTFNEYVQLKNTKDQVIISPPFHEEPEFRIRGKSVTIDFEETLRENTTYTILFGRAISDITENNPLANYRYIFSTGSFLDSLSLDGRLVNAFTLQPELNVFVMLYDTPGDSVPYLELPTYVARTDSSGVFHFYNLKDQPYQVFALKEINGNYRYDFITEQIAFADTLVQPYFIPSMNAIELTDSTPVPKTVHPELMLYLFQETDSTQKMLESKLVQEGVARLVFKRPLEDPSVRILDTLATQRWYLPEWNDTRDTLQLWLYKDIPDTIHMEVRDDTTFADTVRLVTKPLVRDARAKKGPADEKLLLSSNIRSGKLDPFRQLILLFSHPVQLGDLSRLLLIRGQDTIVPESSFSDSLQRQLIIHAHREADSSYQLLIPDSTFLSIRGTSHDTVRFSFTDRSPEEYGTMVLNLRMPDTACQYLLQLITAKEEVVMQEKMTGSASGRIEFPNLIPGKYNVKVIYDQNQNNQWDTGKYILKRAPEKVLYYEKTLEIRANWISEETWDLPGQK
ncbi:MAG: Ig-like domain-containing protein [Bacteroidales bacterium]|nr:Ig-like domain-containing protein [Lentimicrobiaceae bacterium]MDD5694852.1 Ig-like domain-containing protein [Bacteroidales bacterium]